MPNPPHASSAKHVSPALVGLAAWLIPGGGYFLLGLRTRALTIFSSITLLFLLGILVGGIRIMDPPGWGQFGYMSQIVRHTGANYVTLTHVEPESQDQAEHPNHDGDVAQGPAIFNEPLSELGNKPWFVGQILVGPMTLAASAAATHAAHPKIDPATGAIPTITLPGGVTRPLEGTPASHSRSWEIGALYTAVAGMLNLLAIIDSTFRAGHGDTRSDSPEVYPQTPGQRAGQPEAA